MKHVCVLQDLHPEVDVMKLLILAQNTAELVSKQRVTAAFDNACPPLLQHCPEHRRRPFTLRGSQQ